MFMLKFYLKLLFRVAFRGNYYVREDRVSLFYCHFLLPLNSFMQLDHPAFPPDLDLNDSDCFLESNKPLKSGVYKAKDIQKDLLTSVSAEKYQKYSGWLYSCNSCTVFFFIYFERKSMPLGCVHPGTVTINFLLFKIILLLYSWTLFWWEQIEKLYIKSTVRCFKYMSVETNPFLRIEAISGRRCRWGF